jgi:hypothetical protein
MSMLDKPSTFVEAQKQKKELRKWYIIVNLIFIGTSRCSQIFFLAVFHANLHYVQFIIQTRGIMKKIGLSTGLIMAILGSI